MSGLEQSFYIVSMVFMAVTLLLIVKVLRALATINQKLSSLERTVDKKLPASSGGPNIVSELAAVVRDIAKAVK